MNWRNADVQDLTVLWPAARAAGLASSLRCLADLAERVPWSVRVADESGAVVLAPWREGSALLALRAAWVKRSQTAEAIAEARRLAVEHGFRGIVSPLVATSGWAIYAREGFEVRDRIVPVQAPVDLIIERLGASRKAFSSPSPTAPFPPPVLRIADPADLERLADIERVCFSEFWRYGRAEIENALSALKVTVAEQSGQVIGYSSSEASGATAMLGRIAVDLGGRSRGLGASLVRDAAEWARASGLVGVTLCTQESNRSARSLYDRAGFVSAGEELVIGTLPVGPEGSGARDMR